MKDLFKNSEHGSQSVSAFFAIPMIFLFFMLILYAGVMGSAKQAVQSAANAAARDASLARTSNSGKAAGIQAATRVMTQGSVNCDSIDVDVDTSRFQASGTNFGRVDATVTCDVVFSGIKISAIPSIQSTTAHGTSPVDSFRER